MRYVSRAFFIFAVLIGSSDVRAGDPVLALLDPYFRIQSQLTSDTTEGIQADAALIVKGAQGLGEAGKGIATTATALGAASPSSATP